MIFEIFIVCSWRTIEEISFLFQRREEISSQVKGEGRDRGSLVTNGYYTNEESIYSRMNKEESYE